MFDPVVAAHDEQLARAGMTAYKHEAQLQDEGAIDRGEFI